MKLIRKLVPSRLAIAALSVAAIVPGVAHADALAQASLDVTDFKITLGAGTTLGATSAFASSNAIFANVAGTPVPGILTSTTIAGPDGGSYNPATHITGVLSGNYSGGYAHQEGDATTATGAKASTDAKVSIVPKQGPTNNSQGNNGLLQSFDVLVGGGGSSTLGLTFNADVFLRAYLDAMGGIFLGGSSQASTTWRLDAYRITGAGGSASNPIATWTPGNGFTKACDGTYISGCSQTAAYSLNNSDNAFFDGEDNVINDTGGAFSLDVSLLSGYTYRFQVTHQSQANADIEIPEPGSLALIGLALFGTAMASRRRKA